jgi:hypothetical protein
MDRMYRIGMGMGKDYRPEGKFYHKVHEGHKGKGLDGGRDFTTDLH